MPNTLSACMVIRNEIDRLPPLIKHLRGIVDEIVVVDQQSTDGSLDYAIKYADVTMADVHTGYACSSRRLAEENSHGNWILVVDADEFVTPHFASEIPNLITQEVDGFMCCFAHSNGDPDKGVEYWLGNHEYSKPYIYRLFRRGRAEYHNHLHGGVHIPHNALVKNLFYIGILEVKSSKESIEDIQRYAQLAGDI